LRDGLGTAPDAKGLEVGKMAVGTVGGAVTFQIGMAVDDVEDVAEELIGLFAGAGWMGGGAAVLDGAFQGSEESELALGAGAYEGTEMAQALVAVEDA